ncbi:hypothetical protein SESBI_23093 [Sesbania bispinosa]|nr:hypothetical protein SESBI_23093 [Sesbania bispinosa]
MALPSRSFLTDERLQVVVFTIACRHLPPYRPCSWSHTRRAAPSRGSHQLPSSQLPHDIEGIQVAS